MAFLPYQHLRALAVVWGYAWLSDASRATLAKSYTAICLLAAAYQWRRSKVQPMVASDGRWALVTGASSGIGGAIATELAAKGFSVALVARSEAVLGAKQAELRRAFPSVGVAVVPHDLSGADAAAALVAKLGAAGVGEVGVLVNNAGVGLRAPLAAVAGDKLERCMLLNTLALAQLCRLLLPPMLARHSGRILNISSITGEAPAANGAVYHGTKAFVSMFSLSLQHEVEHSGVGVTCSFPGATDTAFAAASGASEALAFHAPLCHHSAEEVARRSVAGLLRGDVAVAPPGIMNRLYTDVVVPFFPPKAVLFVATTFWRPVAELGVLAKLFGAKSE